LRTFRGPRLAWLDRLSVRCLSSYLIFHRYLMPNSHAASPARQPECCSRAVFFFPLHEPGISEELVILNRRGITARSSRSYALFATCVLLVVGMALLSLGSRNLRTHAAAGSAALSTTSTPLQSVLSSLP